MTEVIISWPISAKVLGNPGIKLVTPGSVVRLATTCTTVLGNDDDDDDVRDKFQ